MYTSGGEVILGHFLCLDVENMGLDDISWRRLHFLETLGSNMVLRQTATLSQDLPMAGGSSGAH